MLFKKLNSDSKLLKEINFQSEKEIHKFVSNNLEELFGLEHIKDEFSIKNSRIDTLAYDNETNSFVVIEYKNTKSFSVVDQGIAYLSNMLNNKADFILEFNENKQTQLTRNYIDWSQSKVIFISPFFSNYQKEAINFKDLPIELWQIKQYENNLVYLNQVNVSNPIESFNKISTETKDENSNINKVKKQIKVYTEEDHLRDKPDFISDLYEKIKDYVLSIDERINVKATKIYISFTINKKIIIDVTLLKSKIKIWLNVESGKIKDERNIFRDVSKVGRWGNGDYEVSMDDDSYFEYVMQHIKDVYRKLI